MSDGNGEGDGASVGDLTVRILREIRDELRGTNERLDSTNERLETGFADVNRRLDRLSGRIDNVLLGPMGESVRELTARVQSLEAWRSESDPKS